VLCTLAWLASLSQDGCDYSRITGPVVQDVTGSADIPFLEIGFVAYREPTQNDDGSWRVVYTGSCNRYDSSLEDGYWRAAKGFAFGSLVLGGASALFLWFSSCFVFSRGTWKWAGMQVILAFICQSFAFLWFGTAICKDPANNCALFYGSRADICAAVFYFVSALMICCRYPKPQPKPERENPTNAPQPSVEVTDTAPELPIEGDASATIPVADGNKFDLDGHGHKMSDVEII
jgi:hypothetical protein